MGVLIPKHINLMCQNGYVLLYFNKHPFDMLKAYAHTLMERERKKKSNNTVYWVIDPFALRDVSRLVRLPIVQIEKKVWKKSRNYIYFLSLSATQLEFIHRTYRGVYMDVHSYHSKNKIVILITYFSLPYLKFALRIFNR